MNHTTLKIESVEENTTFTQVSRGITATATKCLNSCHKLVARIERVKNNLVTEFRETFQAHDQLLKGAIIEAEALAWQTAYPELVFPDLALEKLQAAVGWEARQEAIRRNDSAYALSF